MSTGGTGTAGTGGSTGGTTGGTTAAGGAGAGGTAGTATGGGGGGGMEGFACAGKIASCNFITEFSTATAASFGSGDFTGGITVFGSTATTATTPAYARVDTDDTGAIHVTGTVTGYGFGFGLWFAACSDLSAFTGVEFTMGGTTTHATKPNAVELQVQTNSDYPWEAAPMDKKGGCTATDKENVWGSCIAPKEEVAITETPAAIPVLWAAVGADAGSEGTPVPWSPTMSPSEVIGIQWQFPWSETAMPYEVDVTLESIRLTGGDEEACPTIGGGMAGAGGMGGMAGTAGQSSGGAGAGGMAGGGAGGAGAGGAGSGNAGTAGMSGSGSSGGGAGGNG
jgi:hypothetical protein